MIYCVAEEKVIDRSELVHGLEIQKGQYVTFTSEELKKLESGAATMTRISRSARSRWPVPRADRCRI